MQILFSNIRHFSFRSSLIVKSSSHRCFSNEYSSKVFLKDSYSHFTFSAIDQLSKQLSRSILNTLDTSDLQGNKIAVYCNNNYTYLISLLAIWHSNGVPLCLSKLYPANYLEYFLKDSKCKLIVNGFGHEAASAQLNQAAKNAGVVNHFLDETSYFQALTQDSSSSQSVHLFCIKYCFKF